MVEFNHSVPTPFLEVIKERLAKMVKRCEKFGMPVPVLSLDGIEMKVVCKIWHTHQDTCARAEFTKVRVTGEEPALGDYSLVASIDDLDGKPFFRPVPGATIPEKYRDADPRACEHCNVNRFRTETFIVVNNMTGEFLQVGRQCIRDFLGWDIAPLVRWWESIGEIIGEYSDDYDWGTYVKPVFDPTDIISTAAQIVAVDGKYHKSFEEEDSTKSKIFEFIFPPQGKPKWYEEFVNKYTSQPDRAAAILEATLKAIEGIPSNTSNDWLYNVKVAADASEVTTRQVGVLASSVILGMRNIEQAAVATASQTSDYIGNVGDKVTVQVRVTDKRYFESNYGGSYLYTFITDAGNIVKWFASNAINNTETGDIITITGTIKKLEEFRGQRQTMLTRCKVTRS